MISSNTVLLEVFAGVVRWRLEVITFKPHHLCVLCGDKQFKVSTFTSMDASQVYMKSVLLESCSGRER